MALNNRIVCIKCGLQLENDEKHECQKNKTAVTYSFIKNIPMEKSNKNDANIHIEKKKQKREIDISTATLSAPFKLENIEE
jgi:hypothetical protein